VLADEPTGNLDSRTGQEVFNLMREMNLESGVAFIMITHDQRLTRAADRMLLIEDGVTHEVGNERLPSLLHKTSPETKHGLV